MGVIVKWSIVLAVLVTVVSLAIMGTGMHRNPVVGGLASIGLAIVLNVVVVVLALRQTAPGSAYVRQLLNGALIGVIAGCLIFASSWMMLSFVFPNAIAEMKTGYVETMQAAGATDEQVEQLRTRMESATPVNQAVPGLVGTFFTSLIVAAVAGAFLRKK